MNVFEEMRTNRAAQAQIRREDRRAEREEDRQDRREKNQHRQTAAAARRERLGKAGRWVATHPVELLMAVIVVVPALLAWTAMADYGTEVFGPELGWGLPLFSEGAMWAFAAALHAARREQRPTAWLQLGVWTFAAVAGVLNFVHGLDTGHLGHAVVMAVVSVGGVIAHQIITASPMRTRRSRAEKRQARTQRIAARRVTRMERKALRQAVGALAADGTVALIHQPGTVTLQRCWHGRRHLVRTSIPGLNLDGPDQTNTGLAGEVEAWLATTPALAESGSITPVESTPIDTDSTTPDLRAVQQESTPNRSSIREPERRSMDQLRAELREAIEQNLPLDDGKPIDPTSAESIRRGLRCAPKKARELRDEWNDGPTAVAA